MGKTKADKKKGNRMAKEASVKENYLVTKANQLIEARYRLTVREQRFVLLMVSTIEPEDDDLTIYRVPTGKLIEVLGWRKEKDARKRVLDLIEGLEKKKLKIRKKESWLSMRWFASLEEFDDGSVEIEFSKKLKPYLIQLQGEFTRYRLGIVFQLHSAYSIRMYELLKQYETIGSRRVTLEDLRLYLGVEDGRYKLYGHFKDRVLLFAQAEIKEKTDISFTFDEVKQGRKVVALDFGIKPNKETDGLFPALLDEPIQPVVKELMTVLSKRDARKIWEAGWSYLDDEARVQITPLVAGGLSFDQYLREKLQLLKEAQKKQNISNPKGWLKRAVKGNWIDAQQERKQTRSKRKVEFQKRAQEEDERRQREDEEMRQKEARNAQLDARYIALSPVEQTKINKRVYERLLSMDDFSAYRVEIERLVREVGTGAGLYSKLPAGTQVNAQHLRRELVSEAVGMK